MQTSRREGDPSFTSVGHTKHSDGASLSSLQLGSPLYTPNYFSAREWVEHRELDNEQDGVDSDREVSEALPVDKDPLISTASPPVNASTHEHPPRLSRTQNKNKKYQQKLNVKRATQQEQSGGRLKQRSRRYTHEAINHALMIEISYRGNFKPTKPGWIGSRDRPDSHIYELDELTNPNGQWKMGLVEWDGRTCHPIVDAERRVIGVLGGMPRSEDWGAVQLEAACAIDAARERLLFEPKYAHHRRGDFPALAVGVSHGGGQKIPGVLRQSLHNGPILDQLMQTKSLRRISGFANCLFESYAPRLYNAYQTALDDLHHWSSDVVRNYPRTAWAASSINFGPRTVSYPHVDFGNLSWGWCAITALGEFDANRGGHLVLWDLNLVIRFPPGSTIIIPSAMIRHSNTPIGAQERRYSYAQYSAGGLFRWVDNGFQTDTEWCTMENKSEKVEREEEGKVRWQKGLDMLSLLDEF